MTSSDGSTFADSAYESSRKRKKCKGFGSCSRGNWSAMNIAAMVVGFVLFWPVGLVLLYWNITGRDVKDLPAAVQGKWNSMFGHSGSTSGRKSHSRSGNSVFEEYQQTQYDRIREIKEEIENRARRFKEFRENAKRRAEEEEFRSFMSSNPDNKGY